MLSLYKRGNIWHVRGTVSYAGEVKKIRRSTERKAKREAEEVCRALEQRTLNEMRGGINLTPFNEAADSWLKKINGKTDKRNAELLKTYFKTLPVSAINAEAWDKFVRLRLKGCIGSSINRVRTSLVSIATHASAPYVADAIDKELEEDDRMRFLTIKEQHKLLNAYAPFIRPYFITLAYQGFRRQETLNIKKSHINYDTETVTIWRKSKRHPNGKRQVVQLHNKTISSLMAMPKTESEYQFTNRFGKPYANGDSLKGIHTRACKKAGIHDFTIHDWRHHWASHMMMNGSNIKTLMKLGGWATERMVMKYADVADEHMKDTLNKLK
jgi:integrase